MLLDAMRTRALDELLLELEGRRGPEEEVEEEEDEAVVVEVVWDAREADGLLRC